MKKKIAIVSIYGNFNFGNKLQNYAIQKICRDFGYNSEILKISNEQLNNQIQRLKFQIKSFICEKILKRWYRNKNFYIFEKNFLNTSQNYIFSGDNNKKIVNNYDYFIIGSDQVWNPHFGLKENMAFLEFVFQKTRIAFSASFGVNEIKKELHEKYKNGLNRLDYISIREEDGKKIVEDLTNRKDVEVLVDPTMLLTKEEWQKVSKKPSNLGNEKYILNYFLGNLLDNRKNQIEDLAKKHGYKVINILDENDPFYNSGPSEFVYLEEHAELICTDSFHSSVFGILMNTPFVIFDREDKEEKMNSRIDTLLSKFKLEDRKYTGFLDDCHLKCNYSNSYKILEEERKKANNFLRKALSDSIRKD